MKCDSKEYVSRTSKISGQVNALESMFDQQRSAQDILQQIIAVRSSLSSLAKFVVEAEVKGCLPADKNQTPVAQLVDTLFKVT